MRYLVLLAADETVWPTMAEAERQATLAQHDAFDQAVRARGRIVGGEALAETTDATTLRHRDGRVVLSDGPYAETAEQLGGFYLVDLPDLDTVLDACAALPPWYAVEIRPVVDPPG